MVFCSVFFFFFSVFDVHIPKEHSHKIQKEEADANGPGALLLMTTTKGNNIAVVWVVAARLKNEKNLKY